MHHGNDLKLGVTEPVDNAIRETGRPTLANTRLDLAIELRVRSDARHGLTNSIYKTMSQTISL